jgi:hypothetical protein
MVLWKKSQMGWRQVHVGECRMRFPWRCGGRYNRACTWSVIGQGDHYESAEKRDFLGGRLVWDEKEHARMAYVLLHWTYAGEFSHGPI